MQIVIEIPENEYRYIKEIYEKNDNIESTYSYIYHGTPLPKGHGDLIDKNDLDITYDNEILFVEWEDIEDAEVIIKADTEG